MQDRIQFKIETQSNLFIGGAPVPFEIGGIDQQTALDEEGFPCIPGSSFKGALRTIVREDKSHAADVISQLYAAYLKEDQETNQEMIRALVKEEEALERIEDRYKIANEQLSAEYLFGISKFNETPKLIFGDLLLHNEFHDIEKCFSIDMKNSIDTGGEYPRSNPRTYKAARRGLVFAGEIRLYKMELLGPDAEQLCKRYVMDNLMKFNDGIYRLGDSKSRGYGKVKVTIEEEEGAPKV